MSEQTEEIVFSPNALRSIVERKCYEDPNFLEALTDDPKATLKALFSSLGDEFASELDNFEVVLIPQALDEVAIPITLPPEDLTPEQLEAVSGGAIFLVAAGITTYKAVTATVDNINKLTKP